MPIRKIKPFVIWFTGLSGSGKSTLSTCLYMYWQAHGIKCKILDGDVLRSGINNDLGFSIEDRRENIRRAAEINKLFLCAGFCTINAFITPTEELRKMVRIIIAPVCLIEINLCTPLSTCIERDAKGLYKAALSGKILDFSGIDSIFEPPLNSNITIDTSKYSIESSVVKIIKYLKEMGTIS